MNQHRSRRHAFTLVELLVVIGIIALLISVLLPALSRAQGVSRQVKCASNLKQVGTAFEMYLLNSKGVAPWGLSPPSRDWPDASGNPQRVDWIQTLTLVLQRGKPGSLLPPDHEAFSCPERNPDLGSGRRTFTGHMRVMPNSWDSGNSMFTAPPKITKLKRVSDQPLAWDAIQIRDFDGNAQTLSYAMDDWRYYNPFSGQLENREGRSNSDLIFPYTKAGQVRNNRDVQGFFPTNDPVFDPVRMNIRFRHLKDTVSNVLYVDGHVGPIRVGEATVGMFSKVRGITK